MYIFIYLVFNEDKEKSCDGLVLVFGSQFSELMVLAVLKLTAVFYNALDRLLSCTARPIIP